MCGSCPFIVFSTLPVLPFIVIFQKQHLMLWYGLHSEFIIETSLEKALLCLQSCSVTTGACRPGSLPRAAWWSPPGLWCCSTGASQTPKTTCPTLASCQLALSCLPPSSSSRIRAAAKRRTHTVQLSRRPKLASLLLRYTVNLALLPIVF